MTIPIPWLTSKIELPCVDLHGRRPSGRIDQWSIRLFHMPFQWHHRCIRRRLEKTYVFPATNMEGYLTMSVSCPLVVWHRTNAHVSSRSWSKCPIGYSKIHQQWSKLRCMISNPRLPRRRRVWDTVTRRDWQHQPKRDTPDYNQYCPKHISRWPTKRPGDQPNHSEHGRHSIQRISFRPNHLLLCTPMEGHLFLRSARS